jgi:hypothetical protein
MALNGWMISESKIGKDVGESGVGPNTGTTLPSASRQCGKTSLITVDALAQTGTMHRQNTSHNCYSSSILVLSYTVIMD